MHVQSLKCVFGLISFWDYELLFLFQQYEQSNNPNLQTSKPSFIILTQASKNNNNNNKIMATPQPNNLYGMSQFCPSTSSSSSITCYDSCCCLDTNNNSYYCCDCGGFPIFVMVLMIVLVFVFFVLLIVGIRKFMMNRRNLGRNIGVYRQFGNQAINQPGNIIYQPNYNPNAPNTYFQPTNNSYQDQFNRNPPYHPQQNYQPPHYQQNSESIYMGQPVNESDHTLKNQKIYVH